MQTIPEQTLKLLLGESTPAIKGMLPKKPLTLRSVTVSHLTNDFLNTSLAGGKKLLKKCLYVVRNNFLYPVSPESTMTVREALKDEDLSCVQYIVLCTRGKPNSKTLELVAI
jgi:hypothetical protein